MNVVVRGCTNGVIVLPASSSTDSSGSSMRTDTGCVVLFATPTGLAWEWLASRGG
jgi:hypothetical protein